MNICDVIVKADAVSEVVCVCTTHTHTVDIVIVIQQAVLQFSSRAGSGRPLVSLIVMSVYNSYT